MAFTAGQVLTATQLNALDINSLTVDTDTLVVDASDDRVGVNRSSPIFPLHAFGSTVDSIIGVQSGDEGAYIAFIDSTSTGNVYDQRVGVTGNNLKFQTGATDRMTILSGGAVGIGTNSPLAQLHVNSGSTNTVAEFESSDSEAYIAVSDNSTSSGTQVAIGAIGDALRLRAGNANRVAITSSGNVGIATTSPAHPLDVVGEARFSTSVQFNNGGQVIRNWSSGGAIDGLLPGSTFGGILEGNTSGHFVLGIRDNDHDDSVSIISGGGNYNTDSTYDKVVAYFAADGTVGIGTSSPGRQLEVAANVPALRLTDLNNSGVYHEILGDGSSLSLEADDNNQGSDSRINFKVDGTERGYIDTSHMYITGTDASYVAADPATGTGNDAEWTSVFSVYLLRRNSSTAAEKRKIQEDLEGWLTPDMVDSIVPKMWTRDHALDYPEIGPIAEDMDAISPFLGVKGTDANGDQILTGIDRNAYLSLLVLALQDARARLTALEAG